MTEHTTSSAVDRRRALATVHRRGVRQVTGYVLSACWYIGIWFWAIALVVGGMIMFFMRRSGDVDITAVGGVAGSAPFFLFVMGIILPLSMIALHVAAGGTRRSFTQGLWLGSTVVGVTFGLAAAVVAWAQWLLFSRNGWPVEPAQGQLYRDGADFWTVLLVQALFCTVYLLAGMVIAAGYYRTGGWLGTLMLPLALVPVAVVELSLRSGYFGDAVAGALGVPEATVASATIGGLLAVVIAAFLLRVVLRDVQVRPVEFSRGLTGG